MSHVYWRLNITQVSVSGSEPSNGSPGIAEMVFYDNTNTVISTSGGTASSNAGVNTFVAGGGQPSSAFDGNVATSWCSTGTATPSSGVTLEMQFASAVAVDHFSIDYSNSIPADPPWEFTLDYSDNGTSWTTAYAYVGAMRFPGSSYTNTFYTSGTVYRLSATAVQSGSIASFSNIKFFDSGSTLITGALGDGFSSSWDGGSEGPAPTGQAYNNTCSSWFNSNGTPSGGSPEWVGFQFPPSAHAPASLSFQSGNWGSGVADTPTHFSLSSSIDGVNFTTINSYTSASWSTTCQTQTFSVSTPAVVLTPDYGYQGHTYTISVAGSATHFVSGTTTVTYSGTGGTVSGISVSSSTALTFSLALTGAAAIGAQTVTITTGSESFTPTFTVYAVGAATKRGDIAWSQIRLGTDGTFGGGSFGQSTDGSGNSGNLAMWGGSDGSTLVDSGLTVPGGGGSSPNVVTSVTASSPIQSSGGTTPNISFPTETANTVLSGPSSGSAASPTFRALVAADLPLATTSAFGAVKPDGSTITISSGVISSAGGTAGAMVLLGSYTASSASSLGVTTRNASGQSGAIFASDYDDYEIRVIGLVPSVNDANLTLQFSTNGGTSYDSTSGHYAWQYLAEVTGGTGSNGSNSDTKIQLFDVGTTSGYTGSGRYRLSLPLSTTLFKILHGESASMDNPGSGRIVGYANSGAYLQTAAINAFQLLMSSGNLSLTVRVYGMTP